MEGAITINTARSLSHKAGKIKLGQRVASYGSSGESILGYGGRYGVFECTEDSGWILIQVSGAVESIGNSGSWESRRARRRKLRRRRG